MADNLTVIIVALLGGEPTEECVEAVRDQSTNILVVRRDGSIVDGSGALVEGPGPASVPAKRRRAAERARTPYVGLLEDIVVPAGNWVDAARLALATPGTVACGGPVKIREALPPSTLALALSEYGTYAEGRIAADPPALPGCNFGFRRDALLQAMDGSEGLVDLDVFKALREAGGTMAWASGMSVTFAHPFPEGARLRTRFDHGRLYAGGSGPSLPGAIKAPLLPMVLTARTIAAAGMPNLRTLGWLIFQNSAWAAGEFVGALLGPPRRGYAGWR